MTQTLLYGFSNAETRRKATIQVRDKIAEHLVNVEHNNELFPPGLQGGIGFYRASSTGGYQLNDTPYQDVHRFIEHLNVNGHDLIRIAKFEQLRQDNDLDSDELVNGDSPEQEILSYVEDAMQRVNQLDVDENTATLADQVNGLQIQTVPQEKVVPGVESHIYGITPDGWDEFRRIDGTWIVRDTQSFLEDVQDQDIESSDIYTYDCTQPKPQLIQPAQLENQNGYVVTVGTKY